MLSFPDYRILLNDNDRIYAVLKKLRVFSRKVISFWKGFYFHVTYIITQILAFCDFILNKTLIF